MAWNMPLITATRQLIVGFGYEETHPACGAQQSRRGETPRNRKIVEGKTHLTLFKHAFQHDVC
jgi:hypothetical protein